MDVDSMIRKAIVLAMCLISTVVAAGNENELFIEVVQISTDNKIFDTRVEDIPDTDLYSYKLSIENINQLLQKIVKRHPSTDLALKVATKQNIGFFDFAYFNNFSTQIDTRINESNCLKKPSVTCLANTLKPIVLSKRTEFGDEPLALLSGVYFRLGNYELAKGLANLINHDKIKPWDLGKYISVFGNTMPFNFYTELADQYGHDDRQKYYYRLFIGLFPLDRNYADKVLQKLISSPVASEAYHKTRLLEALTISGDFDSAKVLLNELRHDKRGFYKEAVQFYYTKKLESGLTESEWHELEVISESNRFSPFYSSFSGYEFIKVLGTYKIVEHDLIKAINLNTQFLIEELIGANDNSGIDSRTSLHLLARYYALLDPYSENIEANILREQIVSIFDEDERTDLQKGLWSVYPINISKAERIIKEDSDPVFVQTISCDLLGVLPATNNKFTNYLDNCADFDIDGANLGWFELKATINATCKALYKSESTDHVNTFIGTVMSHDINSAEHRFKADMSLVHYCSGGTIYF